MKLPKTPQPITIKPAPLFAEWLMRQEQQAPITLAPTGNDLTNETRILCLHALPEFRGWAKLLATPGLTRFAEKVCTHLAAGRHTLPEQLFGHTNAEIAEALKQLPPRPAAAIH